MLFNSILDVENVLGIWFANSDVFEFYQCLVPYHYAFHKYSLYSVFHSLFKVLLSFFLCFIPYFGQFNR